MTTETDYQEKIEILKLKAQDLSQKIPVYVRCMPDVKAGFELQAEGFRLLDEMAVKLAGGEHGQD